MKDQRQYLEKIIWKMQSHQNICDRNVGNGYADEKTEQILKNIFIGFEYRVYNLLENPCKIDENNLISQLKEIAGHVVSNSLYENKRFALNVLENAINDCQSSK